MSDPWGKLDRGQAVLTRANGNPDLLGVALLVIHAALSDYLDDTLLELPDLGVEDRELLETRRLGWKRRLLLAQQAHMIDNMQVQMIHQANRARQLFAHGEPMEWDQEVLTTYAEVVSAILEDSMVGEEQRMLTIPSKSGATAVSFEQPLPAVNQNYHTTQIHPTELEQPIEPPGATLRKTRERRDFGRSEIPEEHQTGARPSMMNSRETRSINTRAEQRRTIKSSDPLAKLGLSNFSPSIMRTVVLGFVALLLIGFAWVVFRPAPSEQAGAGQSRVTVMPTAAPTTAPVAVANTAPRQAKIVRLGAITGKLHERPAFGTPVLSVDLKEEDIVEVLNHTRTDEAGNLWQLVMVGDYVGWSPANNIELLP
jgi:hypothetical protein